MYKIYYHEKCHDGILSASIASKYLEQKYGDAVEHTCHPCQYGEDVIFSQSDKEIKEIFFIDIFPTPKTIQSLNTLDIPVTIIDHHKTALSNYNDFISNYGNSTKIKAIFDMKESGASLAFKYFYHSDPMPEIVKEIRDYDLFLFERTLSFGFSAIISVRDDIEFTKSLLLTENYESKKDEAKFIQEYNDSLINDIANKAILCYLSILDEDGQELYASPSPIPVLATNALLASKTVSFAMERFDSDYAIGFYTEPNHNKEGDKIKLSFRSSKSKDIDVSIIASKIKGGGHATAAGGVVKSIEILPNLKKCIIVSN